MGSTGINTRRSIEEVCQDEFGMQFHDGTIIKHKVFNIPEQMRGEDSIDEQEHFFAWRTKNNQITAVVILWTKLEREVIYKIMDESVGPYSINHCPASILKLLTPIDQIAEPGYAKAWRERQK